MNSLHEALSGGVYQAYSYSYPHKKAYRPLPSPVALEDLWAAEKRDALFLYVHIPFCEMRCGFCNLFTLVRPHSEFPDRYLDALERQISVLAPALQGASFARFAIGGGTPTYLETAQLERLFGMIREHLGVSGTTPVGIESSPETVSAEKVRLLEGSGVRRISLGVQSFLEAETRQLARRQTARQVHLALETLRTHSRADINIDLIYGIAGQTCDSWLWSLRQALRHRPEELYLYPLYIREKTGLARVREKQLITSDQGDDNRLLLYRAGRDFLLAQGYRQISMRMFRRTDAAERDEPVYSCQEDAMLGLGAGARSYTRALHYSSEYAVGRGGVQEILQHFIAQPRDYFLHAYYGVMLSPDEQKRRYLIQSLLLAEGLRLADYQARFKSSCLADFTQLQALLALGFAELAGDCLQLTASGMERADAIGPWLTSAQMLERMQHYIGC